VRFLRGIVFRGRRQTLGDHFCPFSHSSVTLTPQLDPILAQGAGLAVEDAQHLARCLGSHAANMPLVLHHYHRHRYCIEALLY